MRNLHPALPKLALILVSLTLFSPRVFAQATNSQPRIAAAVNDAQTTVLRGNTHPLARPEFDKGPAPANLAMEHMLMVLKRSPAQEAALESFMAEQLDTRSPNYHHWLSPAEFGELYGPAQQDIDTITKWMALHGFQVEKVGAGRTVIQFSGTAAQVQSAFHTTIHQYSVRGEQHWANSTDPSLPTALLPVVAGLRSLHNFYPKPTSHIRRTASLRPSYTVNNGSACDVAAASNDCFVVGPNDFGVIYQVQQAWTNNITGNGVKIAIVADSNINPTDVAQFRALFGLPANVPNVIVNGTNPGLSSDEVEAVLDTEWAGAVAENATIDLVVSKSTNAVFGGDLSAEYIIDYPNAPPNTTGSTGLAPILSESFGDCEADLTGSYTVNGQNFASANAFYNTLWQQAAAEGITVLISSGDNGAAGCDIDEINGATTQPAQDGLQVNGLASTPYNVAVGGTDFNQLGSESTYWNQANATQQSALKYIPETTWNDTCTNAEVILLAGVANAVASCSNESVQQAGLVEVTGGSGGASSCVTASGNTCTAGYAKPCFQQSVVTLACPIVGGVVTPSDNVRDLPDVSLFAGDGFSGSFYFMCELDQTSAGFLGGGQSNQPCSLGAAPAFLGVGGTSVAVQAFAGMMALVNQAHGAQGAANLELYRLFATQPAATCVSNPPGGAAPLSTCVFNDVTVGTNAMPCKLNSPNCSSAASVPNFFTDRNVRISVRAIRIFCALGIGLLLLLAFRRKTRRWATATAMCGAVVLLAVSVGCGGGGGGQEGGGGGTQGTSEGVFTVYNAGMGYDQATGLGSVNAYNLATDWASVPAAPPTTINRPTVTVPSAMMVLACALSLGLLFAGLRRKQVRWSTAVLMVAFALSILSAASTKAGTMASVRTGHTAVQQRLASGVVASVRR